jgi:hypothetical protein
MVYTAAVSPEHNTAIGVLIKLKANESDLIGSAEWDDFDTRAKASIDACRE